MLRSRRLAITLPSGPPGPAAPSRCDHARSLRRSRRLAVAATLSAVALTGVACDEGEIGDEIEEELTPLGDEVETQLEDLQTEEG